MADPKQWKEFPIFGEIRWVNAYRRGEIVPAVAVAEHPVLMQRMRDFGTPEKVDNMDGWRRMEGAENGRS